MDRLTDLVLVSWHVPGEFPEVDRIDPRVDRSTGARGCARSRDPSGSWPRADALPDATQSEEARRKRIEKALEMSLAAGAWVCEHRPVADPTNYEREVLSKMQGISVRQQSHSPGSRLLLGAGAEGGETTAHPILEADSVGQARHRLG